MADLKFISIGSFAKLVTDYEMVVDKSSKTY